MARGRQGKPNQAPFHVRRSTLLPSSLRDELVAAGKLESPKTQGGRLEASTSVIGRKDRRKQQRQSQGNRSTTGSKKDFSSASSSTPSQQQSVKAKPAHPTNGAVKTKGKQKEAHPVPVSNKTAGVQGSSDSSRNKDSKKRKRQSDASGHDETDEPSSTLPRQKLKISADQRTPLQKLLDKAGGDGAEGSSSRRVAKPTGHRSAVEEDEDAEIAWLEAKLGVGRSAKAKKELQEDGLDDLLDELDNLDNELFGDHGSDESEDDAEEDASEVDDDDAARSVEDGSDREYMRGLEDEYDSEEESNDDDEVDSEEEQSDEREGEEEEQEEEEAGDDASSSASEDQIAPEEEDLSAFYSDEEEVDKSNDASDTIEKSGQLQAAAPTKYVPPALRKQQQQAAVDSAKEVQDPRLRRQLLGLLNRLSPTSFPILVINPSDPGSLHSIYLSNPRAIISKLLISLIIEIVTSQGDGIGETQVVVLSALVKVIATGLLGGMSSSGGKELAASLTDEILKKLDGKDGDLKGKERLNLVGFIAMLYNAQVIACNLVYDLIKEFIKNGLGEDDVEALLRVVKVSGPQLRHDDPTALKQIIQMVQEQQKGKDPSTMSSRTKFMVESLSNLRNNKIKPLTGVAAEAEASLKKYISNLTKKSSAASSEPLRITLEDLRTSSEKGKWWLTGAAWSGNPLIDKQSQFQDVGKSKNDEDSKKNAMLYKLAKKQGMNTDVRRRIFIALMSSEDYVDACDRLAQLNLTEVQQREIIRVIIHCLSSEKAYNPFYTLIVGRLLTQSHSNSRSAIHSYQITLQFSLWDFFRSFLGETEVGGVEMVAKSAGTAFGRAGNEEAQSKEGQRRIRNLAKAFAWWVAKSGLSLAIFKPLNFPTLLPPSKTFISQFLTYLFQSTQSASPLLTSLPSTYDPSPISAVFLQVVTTSLEAARGLEWFMENDRTFRRERKKDGFLEWATEIALESVRVGNRF